MKIVAGVSVNNEHYDAGFQYMFVDINRTYARTLLARHKAFLAAKKLDKELYKATYWDGSADWFNEATCELMNYEWFWGPSFETDGSATLSRVDDSVEIPTPNEGEEDDGDEGGIGSRRSECDMLVVTEDGFYWTCVPKHTDIEATSETVPLDWVKEAAKR